MSDPRSLVEVSRSDPSSDPAAERLLRAARAAGCILEGVRLASVYELAPADEEAAERVARALLLDPALDRAEVSAGGACASPREGEAVLTVLRRDGVMDPVALSAVVAARELGVDLASVRVAHRVYARGGQGTLEPAALATLAAILHNPVVDRVVVGTEPLPAPATGAGGGGSLRVEVPLAGLDAEALVALSRARTLALDAVEMAAVQAHYGSLGRAPTEVELETIAQTWSEHCKHKTLAGVVEMVEEDAAGNVIREQRYENMLKETIFAATAELDLERCLSVFADNAGVIRFDDAQGVAVKVETHNHPSAIEPYGGAGTGIGGVIRDILGTGLGARPIANVDVFCVGDLYADAEAVPPGAIHPKTLLEGVVSGVRDYGNRMGIPTVAGALVSEPRYVGNPLVYAGTIGLIPNERVTKQPRPGDWIVTVGGRTGRDGIHGATFSSDALTSESETVSGGAVQIGNPIAEKMLSDVLLEVRDRGWLSALTDCGAGGFSSAVGEMAEGLGAEVDLSLAPLKYAGLAPWEVWISEAQERMVLAVPPEHGEAVLAAFAAEDVEAVKLGTFADTGELVIRWEETEVGRLDLAFLHDGLPKQPRQARWRPPAPAPFAWPEGAEPGALLERLLAQPTVASKEWIIRQYDHEVQGASALKPLVGVRSRGPSDAAAIAPVVGSPRGVLIAMGLNPRHGDADPYQMALGGVDEALRNLVAAGGDLSEAAVLDNFSWGDCRRPEQLGALVRAAEGCRDAALAYQVPFISGKDSLNNEYLLPSGDRVAIPGTLLITAVAVSPDVSTLISMDLKGPGHPVLLVGETTAALRGSLAAELLGIDAGEAPSVDLDRAPATLRAVQAAVATGAVLACHDLSEGGLAVAAAEMAFAGGVGVDLDIASAPGAAPLDPRAILFAESHGRFLLEVDPARLAEVERALGSAPWARVGETTDDARLRLGQGEAELISAPLERLEATWRAPLYDLYEGDG
jgi:phosphoribosylformylglycinamidine synthase